MKLYITIMISILLEGLLIAQFKDVSHLLGEDNWHSFNQIFDEMPLRVSAGIAVSDVNNDGFQDLLFSLGDNQCLKLLVNKEGREFVDETSMYNLSNLSFRSSSPHFFNLNNDEFIDFIVGSVDGTPPKVFLNINGEKFELQENTGFEILAGRNTITIQSTDYNNDGFEDLFLSHWLEDFEQDHFWENLGNGKFKPADTDLDFYSPFDTIDYCHNAKFLDINGNGFEDLLLTSDFGTSQVWLNLSGDKFIYIPHYNLSEENGMGSALGDFDNDGDFDWFVTSVYDDDGILEGNWGGSGNKFYKNEGLGNFIESSEELRVYDSSWGWGTTFADFNNDGYQDIITVNGWPQGSDQFKNDHLKLFISNQAEFFIESASQLGILDTLQGRGVSVFDYNQDGCLDIVTSNYRGPLKLYENQCINDYHYLTISLWESNQKPFGEDCRIEIYNGSKIQLRKVSNSSNYVSQNPLEVHFGLKNNKVVDSLKVYWSDNSTSVLLNVEANQKLHIAKPEVGQNFIHYRGLVYPNPATNRISVIINTPLSLEEKIIISNSAGIIHNIEKYRTIYDGETYVFNIDISSLSSGIYYIVSENRSFDPISFIKI